MMTIRALGLLAGKAQLPDMIGLAVAPKTGADLPAIESAIGSVFSRIPSAADRATPVMAALGGASPDGKTVLIRMMSKAATPDTLNTVRTALKNANGTLREAALRALADWPDTGPIRDLRNLAENESNKTWKVLALRGYIRLAASTEHPESVYRDAATLSERPDEMKLILAGLGRAGSTASLDLIERSLQDEELKNEAASAAAQIANRQAKDLEKLRQTLNTSLDATTNNGIRRQVENALKALE